MLASNTGYTNSLNVFITRCCIVLHSYWSGPVNKFLLHTGTWLLHSWTLSRCVVTIIAIYVYSQATKHLATANIGWSERRSLPCNVLLCYWHAIGIHLNEGIPGRNQCHCSSSKGANQSHIAKICLQMWTCSKSNIQWLANRLLASSVVILECMQAVAKLDCHSDFSLLAT